MKKRLRNILDKTGKKNGIAILICIIILTVSFETFVDLFHYKRKYKRDIWPVGNPFSKYSVSIGNLTIALYEDKQDITDKLNENSLSYNKYDYNIKMCKTQT